MWYKDIVQSCRETDLYSKCLFPFIIGARLDFTVRLLISIMRRLNNGFYQSAEWNRCRKAYIASVGGLCEMCRQRGLLTAGRVVHHKTHLTLQNYTDPEIAYGFQNLMLLCQACHEEIHKGKSRYRFSEDGHVETIAPRDL